MVEVNDYVRMSSYPIIKGIVTWISPEVDVEGRVIYIKCKGEEYRLNESSVEFISKSKRD
ncbi:MAG: hypothetical protein KAJ93_01020 [Methanosarcinales archaeon]|nr:hypothetical protein [Methanosarcinales archaeon]